MRIVFICSGLEPGHDGVGDYTRRLAAECVRQGHECRLVALNDKNARHGKQDSDGIQMDCLRCASSLGWAERMAQLREFVSEFNPDWISLQYVPYGFQRKGLPWRFAGDIKPVIGGRPLHIMFHELWIGWGKAAPFKQRMIGTLHRWCILRMLRTLKPRVIHTSNATYVALLKQTSVPAVQLPIFGNIPVADVGAQPLLPAEFVAAGIPADPASRNGWWLAAFFGTLHPEWTPEPLISNLLQAAKQANKRVCLFAVGRIGTAGDVLWEKMTREWGHEIVFVKFGEQPTERVSLLLQMADFGVAVSPGMLIEKSSAAAAMLDHGLPIILSRDEAGTGVAEVASDTQFHQCDGSLVAKLVAGLPKREPLPRTHEIGARFIAALEHNKK